MHKTPRWLRAFASILALMWMCDTAPSECVDTCYGSFCFQKKATGTFYQIASGTSVPCYELMRSPTASSTSCQGTYNLEVNPVNGTALCADWGNAQFRPAQNCSAPISGVESIQCCMACSSVHGGP
jgi:hypothetical protein